MLLFCNGKKDFCYKDVCDSSCEHHDGSGSRYVRTQTFADRVRSMTDEELVEFLFQISCGIDPANYFCTNKKECGEFLNSDKEIPDEWCKKCLLDRLRQPVDDSVIPKGDRLPNGFFLDRQNSGLTEEY